MIANRIPAENCQVGAQRLASEASIKRELPERKANVLDIQKYFHKQCFTAWCTPIRLSLRLSFDIFLRCANINFHFSTYFQSVQVSPDCPINKYNVFSVLKNTKPEWTYLTTVFSPPHQKKPNIIYIYSWNHSCRQHVCIWAWNYKWSQWQFVYNFAWQCGSHFS